MRKSRNDISSAINSLARQHRKRWGESHWLAGCGSSQSLSRHARLLLSQPQIYAGIHQGARDHALIAGLFGAGLGVSELLGLDLEQYHGRGCDNVLRKSGPVQKFVPIQKQHREVLDEWVAIRGDGPVPIFQTRTGRRLDRREAYQILKRMEQ